MKLNDGFVSNPLLSLQFNRQVDGGAISGKVTKLNINFPCYVRLYDRMSGRYVDQAKTDSSGNYTFKFLANGFEYAVVAHDRERQYNAVIQDLVKPV